MPSNKPDKSIYTLGFLAATSVASANHGLPQWQITNLTSGKSAAASSTVSGCAYLRRASLEAVSPV